MRDADEPAPPRRGVTRHADATPPAAEEGVSPLPPLLRGEHAALCAALWLVVVYFAWRWWADRRRKRHDVLPQKSW